MADFPPPPDESFAAIAERQSRRMFDVSLYVHLPDAGISVNGEIRAAAGVPVALARQLRALYGSVFSQLDRAISIEERSRHLVVTDCLLLAIDTGEILHSTGWHEGGFTHQRLLPEIELTIAGLGLYLFSNCAEYKAYSPLPH